MYLHSTRDKNDIFGIQMQIFAKVAAFNAIRSRFQSEINVINKEGYFQSESFHSKLNNIV